MSITVTATQGGSTANGFLLRVYVITGAKPSASQTGGSANAAITSSTAFTASITTSAGSNVYGASSRGTGGDSATGSNATVVDNVADVTNSEEYTTFHALNVTSGATVRGFTAGGNDSGPLAMLEILAAGTLAEDASAPAQVNTSGAGPLSTASFTPPGGSLLVALIGSDGGAAVTTFTVSGGGLTWTEKVKNNPSGGDYAGVWIADVPAAAGGPPATPRRAGAFTIPDQAAARRERAVTPRAVQSPPPAPSAVRARVPAVIAASQAPRRRQGADLLPGPGFTPPAASPQLPRSTRGRPAPIAALLAPRRHQNAYLVAAAPAAAPPPLPPAAVRDTRWPVRFRRGSAQAQPGGGIQQPPIPPVSVRDARRPGRIPPRGSTAQWDQGISQPPFLWQPPRYPLRPDHAALPAARPGRRVSQAPATPGTAAQAGSGTFGAVTGPRLLPFRNRAETSYLVRAAAPSPVPAAVRAAVRRVTRIFRSAASWSAGVSQPPVPPASIRDARRPPRLFRSAPSWTAGISQPPVPPQAVRDGRLPPRVRRAAALTPPGPTTTPAGAARSPQPGLGRRRPMPVHHTPAVSPPAPTSTPPPAVFPPAARRFPLHWPAPRRGQAQAQPGGGISQPPIPPQALRDTRLPARLRRGSAAVQPGGGIQQPPVPPQAVRDTRLPVRARHGTSQAPPAAAAVQPPAPPATTVQARARRIPARHAVTTAGPPAQVTPVPGAPARRGIAALLHRTRQPGQPPPPQAAPPPPAVQVLQNPPRWLRFLPRRLRGSIGRAWPGTAPPPEPVLFSVVGARQPWQVTGARQPWSVPTARN